MTALAHPWLRGSIARPDGDEHLFTAQLSAAETPWLADHRVHETALVPGTGFLELALSVGERLGLTEVAELTLVAPLAVPERGAIGVQVWVYGADASGRRPLAIYASTGNDGPWTCHARGRARGDADLGDRTSLMAAALGVDPSTSPTLYERLAASGLRYAGVFRGLRELWRDGDELYARVELPETIDGQGLPLAGSAAEGRRGSIDGQGLPLAGSAAEGRRGSIDEYLIHPALLDACLHALPFLLETPAGVLLPFEWRGVAPSARGASRLIVRLSIGSHGDEPREGRARGTRRRRRARAARRRARVASR